jgi:hypothetical protein
MNYSDKEKLKRLRHTFELNFRLTRLYANYLELCPELITKEMVDELTREADIEKTVALSALVAEIFGLDDARGGDDRRLIRDYLPRSVTLLSKEKYYNDPYYKNIKIPEISDGNWEFRHEVYPPYRAVVAGDMLLSEDFSEFPPLGFFESEFRFPAVLEGGNEWMTLTPVDLDTSTEAIARSRGKVITFGLGLGYFAYMASEKPEVTSVTVVERSEDVIRLFKKHILPQFGFADKIRIVSADAFDYAENVMPREDYDIAFVDTWRDASDGAPMFLRMKELEKLSPKTEFLYWIEGFIRSRLRSIRFFELTDMIDAGDPRAPGSYSEFLEMLEEFPKGEL